MKTVSVPCEVTTAALQAVNAASAVHGSLLRFATPERLDALPAKLDAAIERLRALKPMVCDLRQAAGLPRHPKKTKPQTEGEAR